MYIYAYCSIIHSNPSQFLILRIEPMVLHITNSFYHWVTTAAHHDRQAVESTYFRINIDISISVTLLLQCWNMMTKETYRRKKVLGFWLQRVRVNHDREATSIEVRLTIWYLTSWTLSTKQKECIRSILNSAYSNKRLLARTHLLKLPNTTMQTNCSYAWACGKHLIKTTIVSKKRWVERENVLLWDDSHHKEEWRHSILKKMDETGHSINK